MSNVPEVISLNYLDNLLSSREISIFEMGFLEGVSPVFFVQIGVYCYDGQVFAENAHNLVQAGLGEKSNEAGIVPRPN